MAEPTPATVQKNRRPEGFRGNGPATALLVGHRPLRVCSLLAPCPQAVSPKTGPLPVSVQTLIPSGGWPYAGPGGHQCAES